MADDRDDNSVEREDRRLDPWMPLPSLAGDFTMKPGVTVGPRTLEGYELVMFPYGTQTVYTDPEREYVLDYPCVTITRPGEWHSCRFDSHRSVRHLFVVFEFTGSEGMRRFGRFLHEHACIGMPADSPVPMLFKHMLHLSDARKTHWRSRCSALLFSILEELRELAEAGSAANGPSAALPHQLRMAVDYMKSSLPEPLSVESLARRIGWSHAYFTRAFGRHFGLSPIRYWNRLRMEQAARLLMEDTLSVKEIAARLGFENEHYFSRLFKQTMNMPPTSFRERVIDPRFRHVALTNEQEAPYPVNYYFYYPSVLHEED